MPAKRIFYLLLYCCVLSCSTDEQPGERTADDQTVPPLSEEVSRPDTSFELNIDTSDLSDLPVDEGGVHQPYPLGSTEAAFGYYAYTPSGYSDSGPEYPLLIFLHGWSPNLGNEPLEHVLSGGPPMLIETGKWDPSYPFIVVSPQLATAYWAPNIVHSFIGHLLEKYRINRSRVYLTGLSLGGGGCWYYAGEIEDNYTAAIVPISASGAEYLVENLRRTPVWAFHGARDGSVAAFENFGSVPMVAAINETGPEVPARVTVFPNLAHDAWTTTYDGSGRFHNQQFDTFNVEIYDWLLSYRKDY